MARRMLDVVDEPSEEHAGSMVLRAWLEGGKPDRLRVRILSTIGSEAATPLAVTTAEAVHAAVQSWLEDLRSRPDDVPVTPG
jgi:hypothetical protein